MPKSPLTSPLKFPAYDPLSGAALVQSTKTQKSKMQRFASVSKQAGKLMRQTSLQLLAGMSPKKAVGREKRLLDEPFASSPSKENVHVNYSTISPATAKSKLGAGSSLREKMKRVHSVTDLASLFSPNKKAEKVLSTFGTSLDALMRQQQQTVPHFPIPVFVKCAIDAMLAYVEEEGIFRVNGAADVIGTIKARANQGNYDFKEYPAHALVGAFKSFFRELPDPLLTFAKYEDFLACSVEDIDGLRALLKSLPLTHYHTAHALFAFFDLVQQRSDKNKMSAQNLAIAAGPNLLRAPIAKEMDVSACDKMVADISKANAVIEAIITNVHTLFPAAPMAVNPTDDLQVFDLDEEPTAVPSDLKAHAASLELPEEYEPAVEEEDDEQQLVAEQALRAFF